MEGNNRNSLFSVCPIYVGKSKLCPDRNGVFDLIFIIYLFIYFEIWWTGSQLESGPTRTPLPEKKLLVFILDRLQKYVFFMAGSIMFPFVFYRVLFLLWGFFHFSL